MGDLVTPCTAHKSEHLAPFAKWPTREAFCVSGRCKRCDVFSHRNAYLVVNGKTYYGNGAFCESCMVLMEVGQDAERSPPKKFPLKKQ